MIDGKTMEEIREAEERRRNAARFKVWSARYWALRAKRELEAALRDEKAAISGRLAAAFDEFEASAFRLAVIAVAAILLESCAPTWSARIDDPVLAAIPHPTACPGLSTSVCGLYVEPGLMVRAREGEKL